MLLTGPPRFGHTPMLEEMEEGPRVVVRARGLFEGVWAIVAAAPGRVGGCGVRLRPARLLLAPGRPQPPFLKWRDMSRIITVMRDRCVGEARLPTRSSRNVKIPAARSPARGLWFMRRIWS